MAQQWKVMKDSVLDALITSVNGALTQAQASATAAAGSATTASGHVTSAETARDAAQSSATDAGTSASNALTYRNAAQTAQGLSEGARDASIAARIASEGARDLSISAQTASETARDASITARNESQTARDASITAKNESETARDLSQKWANELEDVAVTVGNYSSLHHAAKSAASATLATAEKNAAIAAKDLAVTARTGSETARDASIAAQGLSETARDASITAQGASEAARDLALQYRDTTLGYRNTAGTHATNAGNSATSASGYATTALGYRDQALGYKNDAEAAAGLAIQGIKVIDRLASTANYPVSPTAGDAYVIENASTLKDEIHLYDGSAWTTFSVGSGTAWGEISGTLSSQTDISSALAGKEPTFTKNTAFNKNFGTTTGTVTQGDDSRLTNSREWTAATILQAEAEARSATTRRAWTAQRVGQAIEAWWATVTLEIGDINSLSTTLSGKEPTFTKNTGFNKNFGTVAGTVAQGNDARFTDARTPTSHGDEAHSETYVKTADTRLSDSREWTASTVLQAEAEAGSATTRRAWTAQRVRQAVVGWWSSVTLEISDIASLQTTLNGKEATFSKNTAFNKNFGSAAGTVCQGNDSRLSDARTPTTHTHSVTQITPEAPTSKSATWTFSLAEAKYYRYTGAGAANATVPPNSSVAYPVGTVVYIEQAGAGVVTAAAGSGVTINSLDGAKTGGQYDVIALKKVATDTWTVIGGVA